MLLDVLSLDGTSLTLDLTVGLEMSREEVDRSTLELLKASIGLGSVCWAIQSMLA